MLDAAAGPSRAHRVRLLRAGDDPLCEEIVGRQLELVNELHIADRPVEASKDRDVLALLIDMLDASRRHLENERRRVARPE